MVRCWVEEGVVELVCAKALPATEQATKAANRTKRFKNGRTGNSLGTGAATLPEGRSADEIEISGKAYQRKKPGFCATRRFCRIHHQSASRRAADLRARLVAQSIAKDE